MGSLDGLPMGRRVLLVEDDADIQDAIAGVLRDEGYQVDVAGDGDEALARLQAIDSIPDVILLDLGLPLMGGRAFSAAKRNTPAASIPVVILSGAADIRECAIELDAAAFLAKPMDLGDLIDTVARVCG